MRIIVILFLILIVSSLGSALLFLLRDRGQGGTRVARALAIRVGLSLTLFALLMAGFATGLIDGRL
ncbi:MAG: twin transmembrane helix small protein [Proteobacteria bacterium]|uniref:twin transmembrane helix small protein n=1 Tax=Thauera sp. 2A1 TaxID=2570191 RepID=UPI00129111D7|nr:twin transmembrane helix small protein [Thauera sp. 2A1]KAI5913252.1 twin transmembrane helix small protein [Thauera sp. 2A1]MBS0513170.1 twin transmembrane helix small protein [Pseudomonadota bacterium]MBS0543477.1 twin transmembrane helix small protein [Pseudomonadota bacterium]